MAMTRTFYLDAEHARERMKGIWRIVCEYMLAGKQVRLRVDEKKPTRPGRVITSFAKPPEKQESSVVTARFVRNASSIVPNSSSTMSPS